MRNGIPNRRRTDRAGWPLTDRIWFWACRFGRAVQQRIVVLFVLVLLAVAGLSVFLQVRADRRDDRRDEVSLNRDEARKYQRCTQTVQQIGSQNNTNTVLRSALLTSRNRMLLQVKRTSDPVLRARYRQNARKFKSDHDRITLVQAPDCRKTYQRGFEHSDDFPDLAPAQPPKAGR